MYIRSVRPLQGHSLYLAVLAHRGTLIQREFLGAEVPMEIALATLQSKAMMAGFIQTPAHPEPPWIIDIWWEFLCLPRQKMRFVLSLLIDKLRSRGVEV